MRPDNLTLEGNAREEVWAGQSVAYLNGMFWIVHPFDW
jgi:hypothetical protein